MGRARGSGGAGAESAPRRNRRQSPRPRQGARQAARTYFGFLKSSRVLALIQTFSRKREREGAEPVSGLPSFPSSACGRRRPRSARMKVNLGASKLLLSTSTKKRACDVSSTVPPRTPDRRLGYAARRRG